MHTTTYQVEGMHCGACETRIREQVLAIDNVATVTAHAPSNTMTVQTDGPLDRETLAKAVASAGDYTLGEAITAPPGEQGVVDRPSDARDDADSASGSAKGYRALGILVAYILGASVLAALPRPTLEAVMSNFMGGFFLAFSFFKFLDLKGFASGFARYDLVAAAWKPWAYVYPFVELALGIAYLTRFWPIPTHAVTLVVMCVGAAGVIRSLLRKDQIKCACLGTVIDLPLGTVTLIEDLGMAAMAGLMLTLAAQG
jgi:copper chaperone CopZ